MFNISEEVVSRPILNLRPSRRKAPTLPLSHHGPQLWATTIMKRPRKGF